MISKSSFLHDDVHDTVSSLDNEIIDLLDDDLELLSDIKRAGEFRDAVIDVLIQIEECLSKPVVSQKSTPRESTAASKLPKLKLKRFNGEVTQWQTFLDTYKSAIHCDPYMNVITKFSYLRDLLEGSAAAAITGLTTTEANYEAAIELLQKRFGDSQIIISGHHDALLKIMPLHSSKDIGVSKFEQRGGSREGVAIPKLTYVGLWKSVGTCFTWENLSRFLINSILSLN